MKAIWMLHHPTLLRAISNGERECVMVIAKIVGTKNVSLEKRHINLLI